MHVCAIMATCGRHKLAERSLRFFLDQDYAEKHTLLIYNNSHIPQGLLIAGADKTSETGTHTVVEIGNKEIILINKDPNITYSNLGQIYNDCLKYVPEDTEVIVHWDDDDIFLPNHITEGVKGLERGKYGKLIAGACEAYKPAKSYYRHPQGIELMSNTLEPSIFVAAYHIKEYKYSETTTDQHLQWVNPLVYGKKIFVDENGPATLIYNWGDTDIPTFKTSGNAGHPNNFNNYRDFSQDHGDMVIMPWSKESVQKYYALVNEQQHM